MNSRREFLKGTGWMLGAALAGGCAVGWTPGEVPAAPAAGRSMANFAAPPMDRIRIGIIGTGGRGTTCGLRFAQFEGVEIHNCCFALHKLSDELIAEAEARRRKGFITSYYVCCNPAWPNTFMSSETEEAFWLGVYPAMSGLDGLLRWAWNSWPRDPIRDASYTGILTGWKAGDTYLVYPDGSPSLRFLELKNGIQTAEKIRILREQGALPVGFAALAARFDRQEAVKGRCDWGALRTEAMKLVNGENAER